MPTEPPPHEQASCPTCSAIVYRRRSTGMTTSAGNGSSSLPQLSPTARSSPAAPTPETNTPPPPPASAPPPPIPAALAHRALFPASFTTALGYSPPADGTTQWIAAAAELIAYRITYAITDPGVALGPRPAPDQAIRAAWYNTLTTTLRNQRQWP